MSARDRAVRRFRVLVPAAAALAVVAALSGCGSGAAPAVAPAPQVDVEATFGTTGPALTYSPQLVPVGATVKVTSQTSGSSSTVTLAVKGLVPQRTYGAHAHSKACGPVPADAGPHFQHQADPVSPSVDPAYANATNEVWLDFTTDAAGAASVTATQKEWAFTGQAAPQSVVIHEKATSTEPGKAGTAGNRVGCVTVDFHA